MRYCIFLILLFSLARNVYSQVSKVTVSGIVQNKKSGERIPYVNVILRSEKDSVFVAGTVTNDQGLFSISGITPGSYILQFTFVGFTDQKLPILIGRLSEFLDIGVINIEET